MRNGGNAGKPEVQQTPMDLVRKHRICRRFALLRETAIGFSLQQHEVPEYSTRDPVPTVPTGVQMVVAQ